MQLFLNARKHLEKTVFSPERWEKAAGTESWKKVVYFLNRGGRFEDFDEAKQMGHGGFVEHQTKQRFNMYVENVGTQRHSLTGKRFSGLGIYEPVTDAAGHPISSNGYELDLSTYKEILGGQSRTLPGNYWLSSILPENHIMINADTAAKLGFKNGDRVRVASPTNPDGVWPVPNNKPVPMEGRLKTIEGIRRGLFPSAGVTVTGPMVRPMSMLTVRSPLGTRGVGQVYARTQLAWLTRFCRMSV